jgi:hypothetical protein
MSNFFVGSAHRELIRGAILEKDNEEELLMWMALIHTHQILFAGPFLKDAQNPMVLEPATQRSAAATVADLWSLREDKQRTSYVYWYRRYQREMPYSTMTQVPPDRAGQIEILRQRLQSDPRVKAVLSARQQP